MKLETETAREKFKAAGLTYADLGAGDMQLLRDCIERHLLTFDNGSFGMELNKERLQDKRYINGRVIRYSFLVNAYYFKRREAITFNTGGFIGFAGWADSINVQPFIAAFNQWVDLIAEAPR